MRCLKVSIACGRPYQPFTDSFIRRCPLLNNRPIRYGWSVALLAPRAPKCPHFSAWIEASGLIATLST
jgi:hypothetical protein